jgi:hypothetical protein
MLLPSSWADLKKEKGVMHGWMKKRLTDDDSVKRPAVVASSIEAFVEYVEKHKPKRGDSISEWGAGWAGTNSLEEAIDLFHNNRAELMPDDFKRQRMQHTHNPGTDVVFDATGDYLDMGRYMSGEPEVFGTNTNGDLTNRVIQVYINASVRAKYHAVEVATGAEKIAEVINALYESGAKVSTTFMSAEETQWIEVKLNEFGEPIDPVDLIAVTHPGFIRRLCFAVNDYHGIDNDGTIVDVLEKHRNILSHGEDLAVYIAPDTIQKFGEDGAVDKAISDIKEAIEWGNTKVLVLN